MAAGRRLPRLALWLAVHDDGPDPELLTREEAAGLCRGALARFLAEHGVALSPRALARLEREMRRYDPSRPTPYERFAAWA